MARGARLDKVLLLRGLSGLKRRHCISVGSGQARGTARL